MIFFKAYDFDFGDMGRLEYHLVGSSLLQINQSSGQVYLSGELDAESEREIKFYCYARDMAPMSLNKQSDLVEFTIQVRDVNEFKPIIQPAITYLTVRENDDSVVFPATFINRYQIECYDKDATSQLSLGLSSIRSV